MPTGAMWDSWGGGGASSSVFSLQNNSSSSPTGSRPAYLSPNRR